MSAQEIVRLMNEEEAIVVRALREVEAQLAACAEKAAEAFAKGGRVIYIGSGTSGRIAVMDAAEMPPTFGIEADRFVALVSGGVIAERKANEDAEDDDVAAVTHLNELRLTPQDIVIGVAASGRTPFVLSAIRHANRIGVWTCGIVNNHRTPIEEEASLGICLNTGPEVLTGSTRLKAGTAQKMALNRISTAAMVLNGKVIENLMVDVRAKNAKLRERCVRIVRELSHATEEEAAQALSENGWSVRGAIEFLRGAHAAS